MICMRYCVSVVTVLGAVLSPTPAQDQPAQDQPRVKSGLVVVEHGDDRVEVRFVPGAAHPQVLINGKVVAEGQWRVEGGEHRIDAGAYKLRVEAPKGGWQVPFAYQWPTDFNTSVSAPTLLEWSRRYATPDANAEPEPYIGVQVGGLPPALAEHLELDASRCVLVISAAEDGPAAKAGIKAYDVVTAIDGVEGVTDTALSEAVNGKEPGDTLTLTVLRRGKTNDVAIEVGKETRANWWVRNWQKETKSHPDFLLEAAPWLTHTNDASVVTYNDFVRNTLRKAAEPRHESLQQQIDEIRKLCERLEQQLEARAEGETKEADGAKKKDGAVRR